LIAGLMLIIEETHPTSLVDVGIRRCRLVSWLLLR
jgi:hypothetical protein